MSTPAAEALSGAASTTGTTGTTAAPAAAAAPNTGVIPAATGGDGKPFWDSWTAPEVKDTRDWVKNKNYPDVQTLAKSAHQWERDAQTLRAAKGYPADTVGTDGKVVPADPQARKAWDAAVGVPETADKYDIPLPAANPYPEFKTEIAQVFHSAGVPAAMATQLAKGYEAAVAKMETMIQERENTQSKLALAQLESAWGAQYKERVALAARGKEWLSKEVGGLNDMQLRVMESVMGTDKFMSAMWKFGAGNKEPSFAGGDAGTGFTGGASEAQARIDTITAQRSAGKISDLEWRSKYEPEMLKLRDQVVAGMAQTVQ